MMKIRNRHGNIMSTTNDTDASIVGAAPYLFIPQLPPPAMLKVV